MAYTFDENILLGIRTQDLYSNNKALNGIWRSLFFTPQAPSSVTSRSISNTYITGTSPDHYASVFLIVQTTGPAANRYKAALEDRGHTVFIQAATSGTTAVTLTNAWNAGSYDAIAILRGAYQTASPYRAWVRAKWDAGIPIFLGGPDDLVNNPLTPGVDFGIADVPGWWDASTFTDYRSITLATAHPITSKLPSTFDTMSGASTSPYVLTDPGNLKGVVLATGPTSEVSMTAVDAGLLLRPAYLLGESFNSATDNSAWNGNTWTVAYTGTNGSAGVNLGNRGKLVTGATGGFAATDRVARRAITAFADFDVVIKMTNMGTTAIPAIVFRSDSTALATANGYQLEIPSTGLTLTKIVSSAPSTLATVSQTHTAATTYMVRLYANGSTMKAKCWDASTSEPSGWDLNTSDSAFSAAGNWGINVPGTSAASSQTIWFDYISASSVAAASTAKARAVWAGWAWGHVNDYSQQGADLLSESMKWLISAPLAGSVASASHSGMTAAATVTGGGTKVGASVMASTSGLTVAGNLTKQGAVTSVSASGLIVAGKRTTAGAVSSSGTSGLTGNALASKPGAAVLTSTSGLSASAIATRRVAAVLAGTSGLTVGGVRQTTGQIVSASASALHADGAASSGGLAVLASTSALTVAAVRRAPGAAALASTSQLTASATQTLLAQALLTAVSQLVLSPLRTTYAGATLSAQSDLAIAAIVTRWAAVEMGAVSGLTSGAFIPVTFDPFHTHLTFAAAVVTHVTVLAQQVRHITVDPAARTYVTVAPARVTHIGGVEQA